MNNIVEASPDERHLALTAPARHRAFHQRIAEMAAARSYVPSAPPPPAISPEAARATYDGLVADLTSALEEFIPPLPAKPLWFNIVGRGSLSMSDIKKETCRYFGQSVINIESARRNGPLIIPRQVGMYLCKQHTTNSLPSIGRSFGGRDHTTVMHAIAKIDRLLLAHDPVVAPAVIQICADLGMSS